MMSVHDALEAWVQGRIGLSRPMHLTCVRSEANLRELAAACDVEEDPLTATSVAPPPAAAD